MTMCSIPPEMNCVGGADVSTGTFHMPDVVATSNGPRVFDTRI